MPGKKAAEKRGRRSAIDIVIAENGDPFTGQNGAPDPLGGFVHIGKGRGIGAQGADRRVHDIWNLFQRDVSGCEEPSDDFRQIMTLRDCRSQISLRRRKPLNPFETASGPLHTEKSRDSTRRLRKRQ